MTFARKLLIALSLLVAACSKSTAPTTSTASASPSASESPPVAASSSAGRRPPGPALVLEAGKGIGVIRLGMTQAEVDGLGLPTRTHPSRRHGPNVRRIGPYHVEFDEGKVSSVEINLRRYTGGIRIGTQEFGQSSDPKDIAAALPGCKAPEEREGGTVIECDEGRALIVMRPSCSAYDDAGVCTGYDPRRPGLDVQVRVKPS